MLHGRIIGGSVGKEFGPTMVAHQGYLTRSIQEINSDSCATELLKVLHQGSQCWMSVEIYVFVDKDQCTTVEVVSSVGACYVLYQA